MMATPTCTRAQYLLSVYGLVALNRSCTILSAWLYNNDRVHLKIEDQITQFKVRLAQSWLCTCIRTRVHTAVALYRCWVVHTLWRCPSTLWRCPSHIIDIFNPQCTDHIRNICLPMTPETAHAESVVCTKWQFLHACGWCNDDDDDDDEYGFNTAL